MGYVILVKMERYYKVAPSHIIGHIYEHLVALRIDRFELSQNNLPVLDYDLFGYTWDTTILIEYRQGGIPKVPIAIDDVEIVICELACEYKREITVKNMSSLISDLKTLDNRPWIPENEFFSSPEFKPDEIRGDKNIVLRSEEESVGKFDTIKIEFIFSGIEDEMRPVLLYLLYTIVRGADAVVGIKYNYFDDGADYAELEDKTELVETYFVESRGEEKNWLLHEIRKSIDIMIQSGLYEKLHNYLVGRGSYELPFSPDELYRYGGYYVGKRGWEKLATPGKIERALKALSVTSVS